MSARGAPAGLLQALGARGGRRAAAVFAEDELVRKRAFEEMRCEMPGQPRSTFLMVFSPDGSKVASTHGNHNIYVTDLKSGKSVRTLVGHPRTPWCVAFHPTSNQIIASGCLGGEVRIWDLSGGSEVWQVGNQSVIASIAFHPNDRILVIATYNELYFWDWSRPEPFVQISTSNPKEKIRYVAFDRLGHKLITGIANSPQTRWERVRAPVPVQQRQIDSPVSPYRLRITPRLVNPMEYLNLNEATSSAEPPARDSMSSVPERERRITASYRILLREYEQLVQRYLQVHKPPTMIDRGTDPMESTSTTSATQAPSPSSPPSAPSSAFAPPPAAAPGPSTSSVYSSSLVMPSRILAMKQDSRKHKTPPTPAPDPGEGSSREKRHKNDDTTSTGTQTQSPRKLLVLSDPTAQPSTSRASNDPCTSRQHDEPQPSTSRASTNDSLLSNIRPIAEEVRNRFLPILQSLPACDRPKLIRRFENSRAHERFKFRHANNSARKSNRRPVRSSDGSSSEEEAVNQETVQAPASGENRNIMLDLEQLLLSILTNEVEGGETGRNQSDESRSSPISMTNRGDQDLPRPNAVSVGNRILRSIIRRHETMQQRPDEREEARPSTSSGGAQSTRTLGFNRIYRGRKIAPHRISAFMPTRVHYNRNSMRYRRGISGRLNPRVSSNFFQNEEPINYSQRPNAEDSPPGGDGGGGGGVEGGRSSIDSMYSNIVQDLETSLNDVRYIRGTDRQDEISVMLSSFSESLEYIMNQSDSILRNLGGTLTNLSTPPPPSPSTSNITIDPTGFYVRQRSETALNLSLHPPPTPHSSSDDDNDDEERTVIESDHNYPRTPSSPPLPQPENLSPLVTSLHQTISYIQRQARLLRQQVGSIERIDRAMFEVEQLQLIRQLIIEFLRYVRSLSNETRSSGVSSVRQMMAGTRISEPSTAPTPSNEQTSESSASAAAAAVAPPPAPQRTARASSRKTYPPSRLHRLQRLSRRSVFVNFCPRRYAGRQGERGSRSTANLARSGGQGASNLRNLSSMVLMNTSSLNLMAARLEHLLTDHTRLITRPSEPSTSGTGRSNVFSLEERMLSLRLRDCAQRIDRIMSNSNGRFNDLRNDRFVVTNDGTLRFPARHFLCLIIDRMSRHVEDLNGGSIGVNLRAPIHNVLAMALLLSDLLLLQLVDSIPPPAGMNLDVERESLTSRIDQICGQMLQNRFSGHSHQFTRSLQHMRFLMRHAQRALEMTYTARRNAMMPNRTDTSRRQLLSIYLRNLNRRRGETAVVETNPGERDGLRDLILRYSDNTGEDDDDGGSPSQSTPPTSNENQWSNNNSDDDVDSIPQDMYVINPRPSAGLYRTNNVNLVANEESTPSVSASAATAATSRAWNVPSVQVNDVPVPEALFQQRIRTHRQRLAERVSELRSFPQMSLLRPRFLHPLYASFNPFEADLDEGGQRETNYDFDMITTVTPNHRIQMWDISEGNIPSISNPVKNIVVGECKIHNDASVDIATDGSILVTLLPSGGYMNVTNKLGIYSLRWDTLGQCLYTTSFEQNAVSVALSPLSRHLVVGLASRRVSIVPSDRWTMARIFIIDQKNVPGEQLPVLRELGQSRDSRATNYKSVNCIRWLPTSGQGLIYATNTGQLVILT